MPKSHPTPESQSVSRRRFQKTAATTFVLSAGTALSRARAAGANDRVGLGFIGVANRGSQLMKAFAEHEDCQPVAVCDVDSNAMAAAAKKASETAGASVFQTGDYRELLERSDVDAVVIASPDHWHALQMIEACQAGKDVYVEKPLSATIVEGRAMVNAARKFNRVTQVGTHRRSSPLYHELAGRVQDDLLGKVCVSRAIDSATWLPLASANFPRPSRLRI